MSLTSKRPSGGTLFGLAGIAVAIVAMVIALSGLANAGSSKASGLKVRSASTDDPGQLNDNGNYDVLTVNRDCNGREKALSASAFWTGTQLIDPQADQLQLVDIKRQGNGYTVRGATDLTNTTLHLQVLCKQ